MNMDKRDVLEVLEKLPPKCASRLLTDNSPIMICRGESGYYPLKPSFDVDGYNARHGVSAAHRAAMDIGSAFGWEVPAADPDMYEIVAIPRT